jgi:hypothetical protein
MTADVDWFQAPAGFAERSYPETQRALVVDGPRLHSTVNGKSYGIGTLETPSLQAWRPPRLAGGPGSSSAASTTER